MYTKKLTTSAIIDRFKSVHGDLYDYSLVNYINDSTKVTIICKIHGSFKQTPGSHYRNKQGCRLCYYNRVGNLNRLSNDIILNRIKKVWGDSFFDFSQFNYISAHNKIKLKCNKHDIWFEAEAGSIIKKKMGCKGCELDKRANTTIYKWKNK